MYMCTRRVQGYSTNVGKARQASLWVTAVGVIMVRGAPGSRRKPEVVGSRAGVENKEHGEKAWVGRGIE